MRYYAAKKIDEIKWVKLLSITHNETQKGKFAV